MPFKPPDKSIRVEAIGEVNDLPPQLKRCYQETESFQVIDNPKPNDWLAKHDENGQTFSQYLTAKPNDMKGKRTKLYILPVGQFGKKAPSLNTLLEFCKAYFMCDVKLLEPMNLDKELITSRTNQYTGKKQLLTSDLREISKQRLPEDAYALITVTMTDLYPSEAWNFVFGEASLRERVGVFSFARYDPEFYGEETTAVDQSVMKLSMKVLSHEMAHMFGVEHCIYYNCGMNGSNHLEESISRPIHLCPIDLRKLQSTIGFDPVKRYKGLKQFYSKNGFEDDANWIEKRIEFLRGDGKKDPVSKTKK